METQPEEIIEKQPKVSFLEKLKIHKFKILIGVLGVVIFIGAVFGAYKFGQKQFQLGPVPTTTPTPTIFPEATPREGAYHIAGIDLTVDKALRVEKKTDKDLLVLTVTFAANVECPLSGGAVCGYDIRGFRLVDEEGFVQDMLFSFPTVKYLTTNPISQRILKLGEKDKGDIFFDIPIDKNKFFLTYSFAGETTEKISIESELFDPTIDWTTYRNEKYGVSFKYPPEWRKEGTPHENYDNPNRVSGFRDECLINYSEGFSIKREVYTKWGFLNSGFGISISVTNPENWSLDEWIKNCRDDYESKADYQRILFKFGDKNAILLSFEGEPGNGGIASHYMYFVENNRKFYVFDFSNHVFVEGAEEEVESLLETIRFL